MILPTKEQYEFVIVPFDIGEWVTVRAIAPIGSVLEIVKILKTNHPHDGTDGMIILGKITVNNKSFTGIVNNNFNWQNDGNLEHEAWSLNRIN